MNFLDDFNDKDVIKTQAELLSLLTRNSLPPEELFKIMRMDDREIIVMQAREIFNLRKDIKTLKDKIRRAKSYIYEDTGPLGNNPLHYTKVQLDIFTWILDVFE